MVLMCFFFPLTISVPLKMTYWNIIHMWCVYIYTHTHIYIYIYIFFFFHQSKQKRNVFVLMVFDSGEVSVFFQGYRPLLVLIGNSLMWLHTLLSYMNEFLNAFLHCKHYWHKPASWCIVCARAEGERERERELGCLAWGQGSSNVDMSFVGER